MQRVRNKSVISRSNVKILSEVKIRTKLESINQTTLVPHLNLSAGQFGHASSLSSEPSAQSAMPSHTQWWLMHWLLSQWNESLLHLADSARTNTTVLVIVLLMKMQIKTVQGISLLSHSFKSLAKTLIVKKSYYTLLCKNV